MMLTSTRSWRGLALAATALLLTTSCAYRDVGSGSGQSRGAGTLRYTIPPMPEGPSGWVDKPGWTAQRYMVAAANPLATDAGYQVLRAGGSAVDASIAVQMVLTLVEPQSSGIGGGAFLMHWDGRTVAAWDGRETAPAAADENLFVQSDGKPMPFQQAVVGGRSVGVPGAVKMLEDAHREHGRLPWAVLFEPAIALAEQGFAMTARMNALLQSEAALKQDAQARGFFYDEAGAPRATGHPLKNPALAAVLRRIAQEGSSAFYRGPIADDIVRRVTQHASNPGRLAASDLLGYQSVKRQAMCNEWQPRAQLSQRYRVCGFPPPSSGHLTVMQILGILQQLDTRVPSTTPALMPATPTSFATPSADWLHRYTEAARLAYADRALYIGDPAFVQAPPGGWQAMLAPSYLRDRAALIGERSMGTAKPGVVGSSQANELSAPLQRYASMPPQPEYGTSHISVVDGDGRAVALTTTIEAVWGSRIMSDGGTGLPGGFLLNNQLTDFSLAPRDAEGKVIANRVQAGKRPRSSMSPSLVFDAEGKELLMSAGSPGGAAIIHFTAKTLVGTLAWGLTPQQAIALPNFGSYNGPTVVEKGRMPQAVIDALQARGHTVNAIDMTSGLQAIQRTSHGLLGGADPRREGVALGN